MHRTSKAKTRHLGTTAFRQQCELYLNVLDDLLILEYYVKMFASTKTNSHHQQHSEQSKDDDLSIITPEGLQALLLVCFKVAMSSYSEPRSSNQELVTNEMDATAYCPYVGIMIECSDRNSILMKLIKMFRTIFLGKSYNISSYSIMFFH